MDLTALGAVELLTAYRARSLSPVGVVRALLAHVERWEPHLHATYLLRPELALQQARASEARWQRGEPCGALDGVPVTLKDNIATRGDPVPLGTAATELIAARADAPPAARLFEAGAVLLCKTTMPDYGMLSSGLSSFHANARNPWDLSKTPGGSSSGAGAAAAAGYTHALTMDSDGQHPADLIPAFMQASIASHSGWVQTCRRLIAVTPCVTSGITTTEQIR